MSNYKTRNIMKRVMIILTVMLAISSSVNAIGYREARIEARYLTDKMAYELGLSAREYDRVYRANLEYLLSVDNYRNMYSRNWRSRNSAMRIALSGRQWNLFISTDYFYRPVSWRNGVIVHNVYGRYPHKEMKKYYGKPKKYKEHKSNYGQWKKHHKFDKKKKRHHD